jgi:hypothetical protein
MLPKIQVASPCTADWDQMVGDDHVRHCAHCDLDVYNFSAMTSEEVAQLVASSKGHRLCGRLYRRMDGTLLTSDCPVGVRAKIRRVSLRVGAALAAAMATNVAVAESPRLQTSSLVQIEQTGTGVELVVFDASRAAIPHAQVTVTDRSGSKIAQGITNAVGHFRSVNLPPDNYTLTIQVPGFSIAKITVTVPKLQVVTVDATLEVASAGMGVVVDFQQPFVETQPLPLQYIPELAAAAAESNEPRATPDPTASNPLRKLFRSLGRALKP